MNKIYREDMEYITKESNVNFAELKGKSILITGATGLIGRNLVTALVYANEQLNADIQIYTLVRNLTKAKAIFGENKGVNYIVGDITEKLSLNFSVDYIVHAASKTSSKAFVNEPVETIMTSFIGTRNVLEYARENQVDSFVYLSTMEVYGNPSTDEKISEKHQTNLDTMKVRSCYPESKRMCESLCACYAAEYAVPVKIARLTQTFGLGVNYNDGRVFAEFARCVIEKKNIVLHTKGETKRSYLYTADAITAILTLLLYGETGEAYNIANEITYCSIYEMATMIAEKCANNDIQVKLEIESEEKHGYAPVLHMNLDIAKLTNLGWNAKYNLIDMFNRMIVDMTEKKL